MDPWNHSLNWHSNGTDDDDYVNLYFILKIKWNIGQLSRQDWLRKVIVCIWDLSWASLLSGPNLIKFKCSLTCIVFFFFKLLLIGDIVNYLFQQYGKGRSPSTGLLERYGLQKLSQWTRILYFLWVQLWDLRWSYQLLVFSMSSYSYFEIINYTALRLETKLSINVIFHVFL